MKEYTIKKIAKFTTDKNGQRLKTRDGREYTRVNLQLEEYGDKWVSGFGTKENENWKEGDKVEMIVETKGEYLNFTVPKKTDLVNDKLEQILNKLTGLNLEIQIIKSRVIETNNKDINVSNHGTIDYPENDLGDSPF